MREPTGRRSDLATSPSMSLNVFIKPLLHQQMSQTAYTETQPKTPNSKQRRCRSLVWQLLDIRQQEATEDSVYAQYITGAVLPVIQDFWCQRKASSKTPATQVTVCSLCYCTASGTVEPNLGPNGS
jgi:hypothetical protein